MVPRPILIGIVGDSASGKTTLTRGLLRILGEDNATHVSADHYLRYDRSQRQQRGLTALSPEANHLDILEQHLLHLLAGDPILKPLYSHQDGKMRPPQYVRPNQFTIVEGLLAFHTPRMREAFDVRVFLDPGEELRRGWKVQRDCSRRGYTTDQVLEELDRSEADSEVVIRPQRRCADIVVRFRENGEHDQQHLDAQLTLRPGLEHPDLSSLVRSDRGDITLTAVGSELRLLVPGGLARERSKELQEAIWERIPFASHLRSERLGEFTVGTQLRRSESLAITQLLLLYQMITARAAISVGAADARADRGAQRSTTTTGSVNSIP
jgi:phosphoribulokinase